MSLKSHYLTLAAMAMAAAQGGGDIFNTGQGYPAPPKYAPRKCEQKKCKSCRKFEKGEHRASCPKKSYCDPLDAACQDYEPKRKR